MPAMKPCPVDKIIELIKNVSVKYKAMIAIGISTGARISEILSLTWRELIDPYGKVREIVKMPKLKSRTMAKYHFRSIEIPESMRKYILEYYNTQGKKGLTENERHVFLGANYMPCLRQSVWEYFRKKMGRGFGTHWMRKSFCKIIIDATCPGGICTAEVLEQLKKILGHSRLDSTLRYIPKQNNIDTAIIINRTIQ